MIARLQRGKHPRKRWQRPSRCGSVKPFHRLEEFFVSVRVCACACVCVCVCVCVCRAARAIGAQRAAGETSAVPKLCTAAARSSAAYNFSNRCTIHDLSATYHSSHNRIHHTNHDLSATYHSSHNRIHHTNHDHTAVLKQQGTCATQRTARHRTLRRPDGRWWTPRRDRWGRCQRTRGSRGCRRLS
jgi:hypothetical protein